MACGFKVVVFLRWPERCFRANADDIEYLKGLLPSHSQVVEATGERAFLRELPTATHAVVWYFKREWFAKAPRLRALATPAAGRELVPVEGPTGVKVHFGGFHGPIIAESVLAFMLAWSRGFFLPELRHGRWPRTQISASVRQLADTEAVILGYGRIGRAIGSKLEAMGVRVHGVTRHNGGVPALLKMLAAGMSPDWFIVALPSDTGTDNLIDAELLGKLPKKCVFVNVGRGNSVDEEALAAALKRRNLAGAYLDVLKYEPNYRRCSATDGTGMRSSLRFIEGKVPNCVVTPHASAFAAGYVKACFDELKKDGFWR